MELNDEEKLNYLIAAGGKPCAILSGTAEYSGLQDAVSVYGGENLVKISMPDEGMYPNLWEGDKLTIAFREEVREGDMAAVAISGTNLPVTVREVNYDRDNIWLIPQNDRFPVDCCSPDRVRILGKLVAMSRDLPDPSRWEMD